MKNWLFHFFAILCFVSSVKGKEQPSLTYRILMQDIIINADMFSMTPEIMSAGYGFEGIIGVVPYNEAGVIEAGGVWNQGVTCINGMTPPTRALTSAASPAAVAILYGYPTFFQDAMPVVFSWPLLPSTVDPTDFMLTLNTGEQVFPEVASINPNAEYNERQTIVIFGDSIYDLSNL